MRPREGDFIETSDSLIFDVKGLVHPPDKIVAFVRYLPKTVGQRKKGKISYQKVYALEERYRILSEGFPEYLLHDPVFDERLCEVPVRNVTKHYQPVEKLESLEHSNGLDEAESTSVQAAANLTENADISMGVIGISGSILVGLQTDQSDIDLVVYGASNCSKAISSLDRMLQDVRSHYKPYNLSELERLFDFRSKDTAMSFEDFLRTETRKHIQGKFGERAYFMRFVKDWAEIDEEYGQIRYRNLGYAAIEAEVTDDSESIFTPCRYSIRNAHVLQGGKIEEINEIASFRGRFCEQARIGEKVIAQGKVERVLDTRRGDEHCRLLIGGKPTDYMTPLLK